ncbi:hypothetical protein BDU57DRAFT_519251 [Ampelomyces quisqualis]|uniref:Transcription-silencing protein Clr2-domain-containing protein n=1 Tax=Ampelomyces quisqualis TaxID=50730 RepID=A0A6A5QJS4_AMPQU|nr:hypothetical protein BDU57DRAFT_519251 [Ampelomyces quisqualis]
MLPRVVVRLQPGSDGDALHVPKQGGQYTQVNPPTLYLEKTAQQWMQKRGEALEGVKYVLEALPNGYTMWSRPRPSDPKHADKYLYGHPGHKYFDSPNRFYPHFEHLMKNRGNSIGCPCTVCAGAAGILPKSSSNSGQARSSSAASSRPPTPKAPTHLNQVRPQAAQTQIPTTVQRSLAPAVQSPILVPTVKPRGRPKLSGTGADSTRVDEEGTPDVYRNMIDKLRRHKTVDEIIEQPLSPDWRAEQKILPSVLRTLKQQDQWIPRVGDIVLYIQDLPTGVEIMHHEETGEYQLYDEESEELLGPPLWQAGLVGEVPAETPAIADIHRSDRSVIYAGVRVEPLPNPNDADKSLSKRHRYVSLRQTRPFVLWKELLGKVLQAQWHATVINALTVSTTLSLVGKYRFRGTWPNASVYCHGIYIGSELLVVGDTVRLFPSTAKLQTRCTEVLVIKTIRLKWSNLDVASSNDYDEGRPYNSEVYVYGSAYSSDPRAMNKEFLSEANAEPPKAAAEYGEWYPLHPTSKELAVPFTRIVGRLYERDAMSYWLNSDPDDRPSLDDGREGLLDARAFARNNDQRITEFGANWFWADNRADALDLQTINGVDVAKHDPRRDVHAMRKNIKLLDGMDKIKSQASATARTHVPLPSRELRQFMAPGTSSMPDRKPGAQESSMSDSATTWSGSVSSKKRPKIIDISEDEDEIRQNTKVVDNALGNKKAKVAVVIQK